MKNIIRLVVLGQLVGVCAAYAGDSNVNNILNTVTLQFKAEQWLLTKSALVTVQVNAAVTDQGLDKIQNGIILKLNQVSKAEWHVTSFTRQQDKSGLESVNIHAEARLPQAELGGIRTATKSMSKPGETYAIENVEFKPSYEEVSVINEALRTNIYQQAKHEIDILNNTYSSQHYYLHKIDFVQTPLAMPMAENMYSAKAAISPPPLSVGNKAELQATVVLASMEDPTSNILRASR